ncbi:MAG: polysaccharide deacetylase family protein [Bacteroidia bacterium]|nr:polysaccharide deacetylase family protein [Bacteroidia bacterium]
MKKIPQIVKSYYSQLTWSMPTNEKIVYLTFDDGPDPEVSNWVMDLLETFDATGTFFLLGQNVEKYPETVHRMIDGGHVIGNHGYKHLDGWKTPLRTYLRDFLKGQQSIFEYTGKHARLFRPPYIHITQTKARYIKRTHKIVMMSFMSGDFDEKLSAQEISKGVIDHITPGAIIGFHDTKQAFPRLEKALPEILMQLESMGYEFMGIPIAQRAYQG